MKLPLQKTKDLRGGGIPWIACSPFIENSRAVLIHRPRTVTTYKIGARWKSHLGIGMWCGTTFTGTKKFTFLDAPPDGRFICAKCEAIAILRGFPSTHELTGKHFHLGGVIAVQKCCLEQMEQA